ncbi:hypothetical protein N431DRAFT_313535, partial [Stipitochalara longipes BDJ]
MSSAQPKTRRTRLIPVNPDRPHAHPGDWDGVRALITRLYVDEDRTLKETMTIMARDHGHHGTAKMYKYRIQRWGLDKNIKEPEAWAILQLKAEREAV